MSDNSNHNTGEKSRQFSLHRPCGECPFSRACSPGKTGGAPPTVYVGQAYGAFMLSCHMDKDYSRENALTKADIIAQCAGAAIFRTNVGVSERMPRRRRGGGILHHLPKETSLVFASPAELIAHHNQTTIEEAEKVLRDTPPHTLLLSEINKLTKENFIVIGHPATKLKQSR